VHVKITLACTPKSYAYLVGRFGESFSLNEKSSTHQFIARQLSRASRERDARINTSIFSEKVSITICHSKFENLGSEFTPTATQQINSFIHNRIQETLFAALDLSLDLVPEKRGVIKDTILKFCDNYNLDPDLFNYEALKKSYYRYRKKLQKSPRHMSAIFL
jgi:hypothetical protein